MPAKTPQRKTGSLHRPAQQPAPARLFLTPQEALEAIRIDFEQYSPQGGLFCGLVPLVFGRQALVAPGSARDEYWLRAGVRGALERVDAKRLGRMLVERLNTAPPEPQALAAICYRVFQGRTTIGTKDGQSGLWVETGMESFVCRRCGRCCRELRFENAGTAADWERFVQLGRNDILAWIDPIRRDGRVVACRLWIDPATGRPAEACPWLVEENSGFFGCRIHEIRPEICRQYPATRKHAEMTGCIGFRESATR